jgi:hypothetical protein
MKKVFEIIPLNDKWSKLWYANTFLILKINCRIVTIFLKDVALDVKTVHLICTNLQLRGGKFHQCQSVLTASRRATPTKKWYPCS